MSRSVKILIGLATAVAVVPLLLILGLGVALKVAEVVDPRPIIVDSESAEVVKERKRTAYAVTLETEMLERGIDAHVDTTSTSFGATTLFIDWSGWSRPAVFNFMRKNGSALKEMGFRVVKFKGYNETWTEQVD